MPTPKRPPAFQFYPAAWFGSIAVETMPPEVEGTYIRLLARQWLAVTLPADTDQLRLLTKLSTTQWRKAWPLLAPHFPPTEDGTGRRNPTLHAVHEERQDYLANAAEAGKRGAKKRWEKQPEPSAPDAEPVGYPIATPPEPQWGNDDSVSGSVSNYLPDRRRVVTPSPPSSPVFDTIAPIVSPHGHDALRVLLDHAPHPETLAGMLTGMASGLSMDRQKPASPAKLAQGIVDYVAAGHHLTGAPALLRGFVRNAKPPADASPAPQTEAEYNAELLRGIRAHNDRAAMRGDPPKPIPAWAPQVDAMFPDGRTWPTGVAA